MIESLHSFLNSWFLWREAMIVAIVVAAVLSYLGVWVVLRKVTFVPLAISQIAALGVVVAFLIHEVFSVHNPSSEGGLFLWDPAWFSLIFSSLFAFYFGHPKYGDDKSVVITYLLGGALVLVVQGFIRQDVHDINSVLYGHAVLADINQIWFVSIAAVIVIAMHGLLYRRFLFVSYDPQSAAASGFRAYTYNVLLYLSLAIMISAATRTIGALPSFGFLILPALGGLLVAKTMRTTIIIAVVVGMSTAIIGYVFSFIFELPAGASMVVCLGVCWGILWITSRLVRR